MISFPKPPKSPHYVPTFCGVAVPAHGAFKTKSAALARARAVAGQDSTLNPGAVRCLIWIERP